MIKIAKHLGGHRNITHLDCGTLTFLKETFSIKTMLDVGCGTGGMVDLANNIGIVSVGIDGDINQKKESIIIHDFTTSKLILEKTFDLGWSVEFVEHVDARFIDNFMNIFEKCKYVCMTHAPEGKGGYHHVNCQNSKYWVETFGKHQFVLNEDITTQIRKVSTMKREFMRNTGLFFESNLIVN